MNSRTILVLCSIFLNTLSAFAIEDLDPVKAFSLALKQSERVSQQLEQIEAADAQVKQAWGSVFPDIQLMGTYQKQEKITDSTIGRFSPTFNPSLRVNMDQPLFRGFREFAAIRQMTSNRSASQSDQLNAERILFEDVMSQYFEVTFLTQSLTRLNEQKTAFEKRISEIQTRVRTGQSRKSDLLATQSTQARLVAQIRQTEAALNAQREAMSFLLGMSSSQWRLKEMTWNSPAIGSVDEWLNRLENRPDIQGAKFRADAGNEAVAIAKGAHFGEADLVANYWLRRTGISTPIRWDAALVFTFPIFQGGVINAQVAEAVTVRKRADLELSRTRRTAEMEVRSGHALLMGEIARFQELKTAVRLAEESVELQTRDYRNGLTNNINVLMALDDYYSVKTNLDRSHNDLFKSLFHLSAVVGETK